MIVRFLDNKEYLKEASEIISAKKVIKKTKLFCLVEFTVFIELFF